jgi:acyl carrier protein
MGTNPADLSRAVREVLVERVGVGVGPDELRDDDLLIEDLGLDSEALLSLVIGLEDRFDVEIPDTDISLAHLGTISRMVDYLSGAGVS